METSQRLIQSVEQLPQANLGHFPTPLDECPRLSAALGGPPHLHET